MKFDFKNIDFHSVESNSNNVFTYFSNTVIRDIRNIEKLTDKRFRDYAEMHNKTYKDILKLYDEGFNNGVLIAKDKFNESCKISSEGGKHYLFEIASTYNISSKYYHSRISIHFKKHFVADFAPNIITNIGEIIGEYYYSWLQILEHHRNFEPLFKPLIDKIKNNLFNKPYFPCHDVIVIGLPDTMKIAKNFRTTLERLNDVINVKSGLITNGFMDNTNLSRVFRYDILNDFDKQCIDFLQETTNNMDNGVFKKYFNNYQSIKNELTSCISTIERLKPILFNLDMSFIPEYHRFNKNWFVVVYEYLNQTNESFQRITNFDNQITGFSCTLHPDTVKEMFDLMVYNDYLSGNPNDFQAMFSKTPTTVNNPIKWLIEHDRGTNPGRGNQTALYMFLVTMLGKVSNSDKRKAVYLFEDKKGQFFNEKMTKPSEHERNKNDIFESLLKEAIKKTPPV